MSNSSFPDEDRLMIEELYKSFLEIAESAKEIISFAESKKISTNFVDSPGYENYRIVLGELNGLAYSYNKALENLKKLPKYISENLTDITKIGGGKIIGNDDLSPVLELLTIIKVDSLKVVHALEPLTNKFHLSESIEASKLEHDILEFEIDHRLFYIHFKDSIESFKNGSLIGAVLTASKVASYVLDNIKLDAQGKKAIEEFKKSNPKNITDIKIKEDEEKVRILIENRLISGDLKDQYIRSIKKMRNAYTHKLDFIPENSSEALNFLTNAIMLAEKFVKLNNSDKSDLDNNNRDNQQ